MAKKIPPKATPRPTVPVTTSITNDLKSSLPEHTVRPLIEEVGEVVYIGDGVCKIRGLPSVRMEDVVEIETPNGIIPALVLGITEQLIEAVVLKEYTFIRQGQTARSRGSVLEIPAGKAMLGRIVTPLGEPIDGLGPIASSITAPVERLAPGVAKRDPVVDQFETGVLVVDTLIPLGKGQRELVIGDRKSGKTRLMANFIMNQKGKGITCVYVAIGAQKAKIRALEEMLRAAGAMDYTCIVLGGSDDPPSLNYIAPYAGTAVAEHFAYLGEDAIIIYDDLSRHAKAYRQMSLLLKRSPGRDAYPGDIFYLHSRLLERSSKLSKALGSGTLTGFPMAETQNGDVSEYICTNLMSITDGHIYLDINLMHEGVLPAVNSGTSVSRIGGGVQPPALRKLGEMVGSQMARYNEVKSFETLNTELTEETEREIKRGKRLLVIFAQASTLSMTNAEKTLVTYIAASGKADDVEVPDLRIIRDDLVPFIRANGYPEFVEAAKTMKLDELEPLMIKILEDYVPHSKAETAKYLIEKKKSEENAAPIIPDPAQQKEAEAAAEAAKKTEGKPEEKPVEKK